MMPDTNSAKGTGCGWQKYLWEYTVRAKALTPFLQYGAFIFRHAMSHLTKTWLNAAHVVGIPHIFFDRHALSPLPLLMRLRR
jgi:hypothetical protein